eukprot:jgi/Tetstr1/444510/TSEL_032389.t1
MFEGTGPGCKGAAVESGTSAAPATWEDCEECEVALAKYCEGTGTTLEHEPAWKDEYYARGLDRPNDINTIHNDAGPDDASWKGCMLQSGSPEPPPAPRGPPLRYYLTTVSADRSSNVSDGVKLNGPLTTARLREASSTATV